MICGVVLGRARNWISVILVGPFQLRVFEGRMKGTIQHALLQPTAHSSVRTQSLTAEQGCRESGLRKPRKPLLKRPPSEKHGVNELGYVLRTFLCCKWRHILLMNHGASAVYPRPNVSHE